MDWKSLAPGDPALIDKIVQEYMSQGKFDQLRRQLLTELDTLPAYDSVKQRMEKNVRTYLDRQRWRPDLPKNQVRDGLKRHVIGAPFLRPGVRRIVNSLVNNESMVDYRPDLEAITRDLLGISDKVEPEIMDTQPDAVDSPDENQMVIATDEDTTNAAVSEEPASDDEKLVDAMEDLTIPEVNEIKEESQADENVDVMAVEPELSDDDSDHSIIKQMSPLSGGTPSPPGSPTPAAADAAADAQLAVKRASQFVGKIPKVKKEAEDEKPKEPEVKPKTEEEEKKKDEKRARSREEKSSKDRDRDRDRRSYKSSRRDRDSDRRGRDRDRDHKSRDSERRKDSDRRDKRDRHRDKSKDEDKSKRKDEGKSVDEKSKRDEKIVEKSADEENVPVVTQIKEETIVEEVFVKNEPVESSEHVEEESPTATTEIEAEKSDGSKSIKISPMTTRSRFRGPVSEESKPSASENVYSKKYLRPARRDIK